MDFCDYCWLPVVPQGSLDAAILLISLWFCRWRSWPWVDPERDTHTSNGSYRITLLHLPLDSPDLTALGMWRSWLCYRSRPIKITWLWIKKDHREISYLQLFWWVSNINDGAKTRRWNECCFFRKAFCLSSVTYPTHQSNKQGSDKGVVSFTTCILFCITYAYYVTLGSWKPWRACSTPKRCGQ